MTSPAGAPLSEAAEFLAGYPQVEAIDVLMIDCHGSGRGKIIRRHVLESLFTAGRGMPASMFAQDVAGDDVEGTGLLSDGGGDHRCWPVPGSLGFVPATGCGQVLVSLFTPEGTAFQIDPRHPLVAQINRARAAG